MAEEDNIAKKEIKYTGVMDVKEIYEGISSNMSNLGYDVDETEHILKTKGGKRTHEIKWECTKNIDKYTRFLIKVEIKTKDVADVDVEEAGKSVRKEEGEIKVKLESYLVTDYLGKWMGSPYNVFLKNFFDRFLYGRRTSPGLARGTYKQWIEKITSDFDIIVNEIKALFHLYKL